ncbi:MAG: hypothetical protein NTX49_01545 [Chlamydiae bacterium]|nr:hypothetical protein [Chlamydiota bacterium]
MNYAVKNAPVQLLKYYSPPEAQVMRINSFEINYSIRLTLDRISTGLTIIALSLPSGLFNHNPQSPELSRHSGVPISVVSFTDISSLISVVL